MAFIFNLLFRIQGTNRSELDIGKSEQGSMEGVAVLVRDIERDSNQNGDQQLDFKDLLELRLTRLTDGVGEEK